MGKKIKIFGRAALALGGNVKKITLGALLVSSLSINSSYAVPSGDLGGDKKSAEHKVKFASLSATREDIDRGLLRTMAFYYERIPVLVPLLSTETKGTRTIKGDLLPHCDPKFLLLLYRNGVTVIPSEHMLNIPFYYDDNCIWNWFPIERITYKDGNMLDTILEYVYTS